MDIDLHFLVGHLLEFLLERVDILAALADDHAGARSRDGHSGHLECALDDDSRDTCLCKTSVEVFTDLRVLKQSLAVFLTAIPV